MHILLINRMLLGRVCFLRAANVLFLHHAMNEDCHTIVGISQHLKVLLGGLCLEHASQDVTDGFLVRVKRESALLHQSQAGGKADSGYKSMLLPLLHETDHAIEDWLPER